MAKFSDEQKKIALLLLHEPKTAEELNKQLNIPYDKLIMELKGMLKMKVVSKEGFPTKYRLKENIAEEVRRRKKISEEDSFKLRLKVFIEMQAIEEELLKKQMDKLSKAIENDKEFTVYSIEKAEIVKEGEYYSSYLEVNFSVKNFTALVKFMFFYGPSSVEIIKPDKIEFSAQDLQDGLVDMSEMIQKYSAYITRLLNREELEKFHKKLFSE